VATSLMNDKTVAQKAKERREEREKLIRDEEEVKVMLSGYSCGIK
jgi:hypothetical protein